MDGSRKAVHCYCTSGWMCIIRLYTLQMHLNQHHIPKLVPEVTIWVPQVSFPAFRTSLAFMFIYCTYKSTAVKPVTWERIFFLFFFYFLNLHHIEIFFCICFVCYIMQNVHMFSHFWTIWRSLILRPYHVRDNSSLWIKLTLILITLNISAPVPRCINMYPLCITSPVVNQLGHGVNHPSLSSAKVEERVQLNLFSLLCLHGLF